MASKKANLWVLRACAQRMSRMHSGARSYRSRHDLIMLSTWRRQDMSRWGFSHPALRSPPDTWHSSIRQRRPLARCLTNSVATARTASRVPRVASLPVSAITRRGAACCQVASQSDFIALACVSIGQALHRGPKGSIRANLQYSSYG